MQPYPVHMSCGRVARTAVALCAVVLVALGLAASPVSMPALCSVLWPAQRQCCAACSTSVISTAGFAYAPCRACDAHMTCSLLLQCPCCCPCTALVTIYVCNVCMTDRHMCFQWVCSRLLLLRSVHALQACHADIKLISALKGTDLKLGRSCCAGHTTAAPAVLLTGDWLSKRGFHLQHAVRLS